MRAPCLTSKMLHLAVFQLIVFLTVCSAIRPPNCPMPDICAPRIVTECPNKRPDRPSEDVCPTCCCKSSENVEFYNPQEPEPTCTAPPARYEAKLVNTRSALCNPDYYPPGALWSPLTGISHDPTYEVFEACMLNVSRGVALVSQTGQTDVIQAEYRAQGDAVRSIYQGQILIGPGETTDNFTVDKEHQYVTGLTMLVPSVDRMMGVSLLRLCNGSDWRRKVKVCGELFSTATRSERVSPDRNSVHYSNCSFGYFEFTFLEYLQPLPTPFPQPDSTVCQTQAPRMCRRAPHQGCRTCCCRSSQNAEFYSPGGRNRQCRAPGTVQYRVSLKSHWRRDCHPDYFPRDAEFSPLIAAAHDPSYEVWNRCMYNASVGVQRFAELGDTPQGGLELAGDLGRQGGQVFDIALPRPQTTGFLTGRNTKSTRVFVDADHSYVSVLSKQVPGDDNIVGVNRLQLCDGQQWKQRVDVCLELLSTRNQGPNSVQGQNCSFGMLKFERRPRPRPAVVDGSALEPCRPQRATLINQTICCNQEYIVLGSVIKNQPTPMDSRYTRTLFFEVTQVFYDDIGNIQVGEVIEVKLCGLPTGITRLGFRRSYLLMGERECHTHELIIGENGVLEPDFDAEGSVCANIINSGVCEQ